jgi:hypothetical protein
MKWESTAERRTSGRWGLRSQQAAVVRGPFDGSSEPGWPKISGRPMAEANLPEFVPR